MHASDGVAQALQGRRVGPCLGKTVSVGMTDAPLFKDVCFGVLDVVSKGGLAMYACYRTT